jgi:hypothetical protein
MTPRRYLKKRREKDEKAIFAGFSISHPGDMRHRRVGIGFWLNTG